ncbi:MAG: zinc-binding protein [Clostridiales bacterium]|nr:zinc-binding protein [Clostridiales bacterium]
MFQDKVLVCKDCGQEFTFTAGEQEFYAEKGFQNQPAHCRDCRANKKRQPRERVQHQAVCSSCGANTTIPFVPKNDAPVYCDSCYKARRG